MVNPHFRFNKEFGLPLRERLDGTYYSILILTSLLFFAIGLTLATYDYSALKPTFEKSVLKKYKELYSRIIVNLKEQPSEEGGIKARIVVSDETARDIKKQVEKKARTLAAHLKSTNNQQTSSLLKNVPGIQEFLDEYDEGLDDLNNREIPQIGGLWPSNSHPPTSTYNFDAGSLHDPIKHPYNYVIPNRGELYIEITDELLEEDVEKGGYRDPEEIEKVVQQYRPMIEFCYRKETRMNPALKGWVKIAFSISYEGYVIPESIRIIESSLRNRKVEQCIKNYIRRWRNFARLDESMGNAHVVQKFIFN